MISVSKCKSIFALNSFMPPAPTISPPARLLHGVITLCRPLNSFPSNQGAQLIQSVNICSAPRPSGASSFIAMLAGTPEEQGSQRLPKSGMGDAKSHHVKTCSLSLSRAFWHTDEKWFKVTEVEIGYMCKPLNPGVPDFSSICCHVFMYCQVFMDSAGLH